MRRTSLLKVPSNVLSVRKRVLLAHAALRAQREGVQTTRAQMCREPLERGPRSPKACLQGRGVAVGVRGPQRPLVYLLNIEPCEQTIHRKYVMFVFKNTHQQNTCEQASWGVGVQGHLGICSCEQGMAAGQGPGFPQNLLPTPWQAGRQAGAPPGRH